MCVITLFVEKVFPNVCIYVLYRYAADCKCIVNSAVSGSQPI